MLALLFALYALPAAAEAAYVNAADLARRHGLTYSDLGSGSVHAAKITGEGREVVLFADLRSMVVNGASVRLSLPVKWEDALLVPEEAVALITGMAHATPEQPTVAPSPVARTGAGHTVVIDPGHGGNEPGAVGARGLREKDVTLDVSKRLSTWLQARGVRVIMTRHSDVFVGLDERSNIANRAAPDLFVSVHVNGDNLRHLRGALVLYPDDGPKDGRVGLAGRAREATLARKPISPDAFRPGGSVDRPALLAVTTAAFESYRMQSIQAATRIRSELRPVTGLMEQYTGSLVEDFRGLRVLRQTRAPSVLVEMDFVSNSQSEMRLRGSAYRQEITEAIGRGILAYLAGTAEEGL